MIVQRIVYGVALLGLTLSAVLVQAEAERTHLSRQPGWSLYFPVHMPGLELSQALEGGGDISVDADMLDLAKHANSFFALGASYRFTALEQPMWLDINGWYGGYDMGMDDLTAHSGLAPPPVLREFLDVNVDMRQRIIQGELGMWVVQDWHQIDLGLLAGVRQYDQTIKIFGTIPVFNSGCGLIGCFEAQPFREKEETSWAEAIFGLTANYRWQDSNALLASISWGHEESIRWQIHNTLFFGESWFGSLGWRRDEFVNDGVEIVESGLYVDVGKQF
ncbi:hypothetical protein C0039_07305 [Pseudohalioglobus lutimaris]|uniref:Uncharacterized protein n=2 Tax=Pseudohalioglobus lutimaris TaxID=1737061 RepID=A0A2N5X4C7_9GAMM|nr:hypothetical protein C0039_07305 [Pseudohalioglobus lutimaris]